MPEAVLTFGHDDLFRDPAGNFRVSGDAEAGNAVLANSDPRRRRQPEDRPFGAHCLDINEVVGPGVTDGIHFEPASLRPVAIALVEKIRDLFGDMAK